MKTNLKNIDTFFLPRNVAIIGVSRDKNKLGYVILENFVKGHYKGKVYAVNPNAEKIMGKPCYPSVLSILEPVDLATIVVPAHIVPRVLTDCVEKGVKSVIIISSGFSEIGKEGRQMEEICENIIENTNTRVIGPNCIGILDIKNGVDTLFLSRGRMGRPKPGSIGFISQSGAVGSTILDWLSEEGIGISKFISYGNAMDVDESDLIEYLDRDKNTKVITMYIESVKDGKKFIDTLKKVKTPVIILKAGKTSYGSRAASSHTGSLAGSGPIYSGIFEQCGVIEAHSWQELFNFAKAFVSQPKPKGKKIAIITDGGGFGVLAADMAEKENLLLPEPDRKTKNIFQKHFPPYVSIQNPIDLSGDADEKRYRIAIESCLKSKIYDGVIAITLFQVPTVERKIVKTISKLSKRYKKPILCCAAGGKFTRKLCKELESNGIPVFETPEETIKVFGAMAK